MADTVFVTGCSSGIGLAVARDLRARGYRVFASARRRQDLELLGAEGLEPVALELADPASVTRAAERVLAACGGRLDALVNNAAHGQMGAVEDLPRSALREQFEVNVFGTQQLTNALLPAMRAAGRGRIVHISSILGRVCLPMRGAYAASKHALEALADSLRLELHGSGIAVVLIEPGPIDSRFRATALRHLRRHIEPERCALAARYRRELARLGSAAPVSRHTLPPAAVSAAVIAALQARRPRARYAVTRPAKLFTLLRRALPTALLDPLLRRG